VVVVIS